jgi:hypothetical protein
MNNELTPYLRPHFTAKIAEYLSSGFKINVYSKEKQGLKQLIDDLDHCCPPGDHFVRIPMRSFTHSFSAYLTALCDALKVQPTPRLDLRIALLNFLDQHPESKLWLCLEDFDQLSERVVGGKTVDAAGYNLDFLNHLNSFVNNEKIAILFTSQYKLETQELYIGGERVRGSKIDLRAEEMLPELDFEEIDVYLQKITPPEVAAVLQQKPPFHKILIPKIQTQSDPTAFMHFIADRIPADAQMDLRTIQEKTTHWEREYTQQSASSTDKWLNELSRTVKHWLRRAGRLVGIGKNVKALYLRLLLLFAILTGITFSMWNNILKLIGWVTSLFQ